MSYAVRVTCEISHLMLIALESHGITAQISQWNAWLDVVSERVKKNDQALEVYLQNTHANLERKKHRTVFKCFEQGVYFIFATPILQRLIQRWSGRVAAPESQVTWPERGCSSPGTAVSPTRRPSNPSCGRNCSVWNYGVRMGPINIPHSSVLELSKGRTSEKLSASPAWEWIWDIPLFTEKNKRFGQYGDFGVWLVESRNFVWSLYK